jgi:hypothetical protein
MDFVFCTLSIRPVSYLSLSNSPRQHVVMPDPHRELIRLLAKIDQKIEEAHDLFSARAGDDDARESSLACIAEIQRARDRTEELLNKDNR